MTEFRRDQARALLVSLLRTLAPRMAGKETLRKLVAELARDGLLWAELDGSRETLTFTRSTQGART